MRRLRIAAILEALANPFFVIFVFTFMAIDSEVPLPSAGPHCAHQVPTLLYYSTIISIIIIIIIIIIITSRYQIFGLSNLQQHTSIQPRYLTN